MIRPIVRRADGRPAYEGAPPRLRQSDIDRRKAWALAEMRAYEKKENCCG